VVVRNQIFEKHVDNGSVSFLGVSKSAIGIANLTAVALLTTINNLVTAKWEFAIGSAAVGLIVRVSCWVVAFLITFSNAVTTTLGIAGWVVDGTGSKGLGGSGVSSTKSRTNSSKLLVGEGLELFINEPADTLEARRCGLGTNVGEESLFALLRQKFCVVDQRINHDLATSVPNAGG